MKILRWFIYFNTAIAWGHMYTIGDYWSVIVFALLLLLSIGLHNHEYKKNH